MKITFEHKVNQAVCYAKCSAIECLKILAGGALIGVGVRAAEWSIPAPEMRVVVCTMSDVGHVETCANVAELLKSAGNKK